MIFPPATAPTVPLFGHGVAAEYGATLLTNLGLGVARRPGPEDAHPALAWAGSGLMALTGDPEGPGQVCPAPLASCAEGALKGLAALAEQTCPGAARALPSSGAALLGERAAISHLRRQGGTAPGGACHLLRTQDGCLAVNLPREDDWNLLPAWLETAPIADWPALTAALARRPSAGLADRGRLLGLAVAEALPPPAQAPQWLRVQALGEPASPWAHAGALRPAAAPRVVDLSSLWAGPLCGHLLQGLGAQVTKVESMSRPDGARAGPPEFFQLLNAGKENVVLDFASREGRAALLQLIAEADIVIEASRPRALHQLGIDAEALVAARPGLTWLSLTGYGRAEPMADWVAFGDDAAVAAGLSGLMLECGAGPVICGDAIADPLTGLHGALAAWASHQAGGGHLLDVSLVHVSGHCIGFQLPPTTAERQARYQQWQALAVASGLADTTPRARRPC